MKTTIKLIILGITMLLYSTFPALAMDVKVPKLSTNDTRDEYCLGLLDLVLKKSGVEYSIIKGEMGLVSQSRSVRLVKEGKLDVMYAGTSRQLENELLPIRFPLMRGLIGNRIFIIHKKNQKIFNSVSKLTDLQKHLGIQGIGWSDIEILESAGLRQDYLQYDKIFKVINLGRYEYFSRTAMEAFAEVNSRKDEFPNLMVEKNVLLTFPFAMFFFVNRSNTELASAIEQGFLNAYEDGSFLQYFHNHQATKDALSKANLDKRVRIEIPNPLLTPETSTIPARYWYRPQKSGRISNASPKENEK